MPKTNGTKKSKATTASNPSRRSKRSKKSPELESPHNKDTPSKSSSHNVSKQQKEDDAYEAQFWKLHVDKVSTLINKCMKTYEWDKDTAKRVFTSYRQFLVVKKEAEDWNPNPKLQPSWSVDRMWEIHTEIEDYSFDMETLCGHVVHRPKATLKEAKEPPALEAENMKHEATLDAVKLRFGTEKIDLELWSNTIISFQNQLGEPKVYKVNSLQPISCFFDSYALAQGENEREENYRFVFKQKDIAAGDTPSSLGMTLVDSNIVVKAVHKDLIKVSFLHSNGDGIWDVMLLKNIPLVGYFDEFATDHLKDTTRKDLVFSFNGQRLYGFNTATTSNFIDGDIIDATPVKEYITEGCHCCKKKRNPLGL